MKTPAQQTKEFEENLRSLEAKIGEWDSICSLVNTDGWKNLSKMVRIAIAEKTAKILTHIPESETQRLRSEISQLQFFVGLASIPPQELAAMRSRANHLRSQVSKLHAMGLGQEPPNFETFSKEVGALEAQLPKV